MRVPRPGMTVSGKVPWGKNVPARESIPAEEILSSRPQNSFLQVSIISPADPPGPPLPGDAYTANAEKRNNGYTANLSGMPRPSLPTPEPQILFPAGKLHGLTDLAFREIHSREFDLSN